MTNSSRTATQPPEHLFTQAAHHYMRNDLAAAQSACQILVNHDPNHADAWHLLGLIEQHANRFDQAHAMFDRAININPNDPNYRISFALLLKTLGQLNDAANVYHKLLAVHHDHAAAWSNLANVQIDLKRYDDAIRSAQTAIQLDPTLAPAHHNLGRAYRLTNQLNLAVDAYNHAVRLQPNHPAAWLGLGVALRFNDRYDDAFAALEHAVALNPNQPDAWHELGKMQRDFGQTDEALGSFRRVTDLESCDNLLSDIAITQNYSPAANRHQTFKHHLDWAKRIESNLATHNLPPRDRDPNRILRIGYVSPDFRRHACASFIEPLLTDHDPNQFELFCYANVQQPDDITQRFQSHGTHWRDIDNLDDDAWAKIIDDDRIDILIDLAGHTADNRLNAFATRLAPIQVTYLGYPNTTGLSAMDYRLTDNQADPLNLPTPTCEKLIHLDGGLSCYQPQFDAPAPNDLPANTNDYITFGSLANPAKINEPLLALWAKTLHAVPDSQLLLIRQTFSKRVQNRIMTAFNNFGLGPDRITIQTHLNNHTLPIAAYHHLDITLDTFPYTGHTTVCESLTMGIPTVTLTGDCYAARMGASVLAQAGFPHWIASTPEQFIDIATQLAAPSNRQQLAHLRNSMPDTVAASPLCDTPSRLRTLERTYRDIWKTWLRNSTSDSHDSLNF